MSCYFLNSVSHDKILECYARLTLGKIIGLVLADYHL
jgi:hypothetical protein